MPLYHHRYLAPAGELGLWKIEEPESWFRDQLMLSPLELRQLSTIKGRKRVEWMSVRHLIHIMSGRERRGAFFKDEFGKPHLENSPWQISVSHTDNMAAAMAAPGLLGVDIQHLVGKIGRLAPRFMRPEETQCLQAPFDLEHLHVFWGAKESLYKAYGRRRLDFLEDIRVTPFTFQPAGGETTGSVIKDGEQFDFRIRYEMMENYVLVYALQVIPPSPA